MPDARLPPSLIRMVNSRLQMIGSYGAWLRANHAPCSWPTLCFWLGEEGYDGDG